MNDINVLIVDDQNLFAKLIHNVLQSIDNINVVGTAPNVQSALSIARTHKLDVILLDINLPDSDGITALAQFSEICPSARVLMLSSFSEAEVIQQSIRLGASGYITKGADTTELIDAIYNVYNGENYFCKFSLESIMNNMINSNNTRKSFPDAASTLSKREKEVLKLIASELSSTKISKMLNISVRTVQTHRKHLLQKLGAKNTVGLIKTAIEAKLISN